MNTFDIISRLGNIKERLNVGDTVEAKKQLDLLYSDLVSETEHKKLPKASANIFKAAQKFAKKCYNENRENGTAAFPRPALAGANFYTHTDGSKRQYICDGFLGVSYSKAFAGLCEAEAHTAIDFAKIVRIPEDTIPFALPDLAAIKHVRKMEIAQNGRRKNGRNIIKLPDGKCFYIDLFIDFMEVTGCVGGEMAANTASPFKPLFVSRTDPEDGNEIAGVALPMRPSGNMEERILIDLTKEVF